MNNQRISVEDQRQMGIVRQQYPPSYVPASPQPVKLDVLPSFEASLNVEHPARQEVIVTTSAVDRGKAFQMMILPIAVVLAILAVIVSLAFGNELFKFATLLVFWITFAIVYVVGMGLTALATPEAVSLYSAKRQWDVIDREQQERWGHYRWQSGRIEQRDHFEVSGLRGFLKQYIAWLILVGLAYGTLVVFVLMNLGNE